MPSTYSSNLRLELQATGENTATWGTKANNVFEKVEDAICGYVSIALADANYSLTAVNGTTDEARMAIVDFTGALTAGRTITIPSVSKVYYMRNSTTGGFSLSVKTSGGNTITIGNGNSVNFFCDGTNCVKAFEIDLNEVTSGTLAIASGGTGAITAAAARTSLGADNASNLTTGSLADARLSSNVPLKNASNTFTGATQTIDPVGAGASLKLIGDGNSGIDVGRTDNVASTPFIDFHSGTDGTNDYDARIQCTGGNTSDGQGTVNIIAAALQINGVEVPTSSSPAFASGTRMLFQQTSAPTGWTKDTTHNNKAVRLTTGSVTTGGTTAFTSVFTSRTPGGSIGNTTATGTVGDTALTTSQLPAHTHGVGTLSGTTSSDGNHSHSITTATNTPGAGNVLEGTGGSDSETTSSAGAHTHTVSLSGATASAGSGATHTHSFTGSSHNHTFTGTAMDFAVQYVDFIIAVKD